MVARGVRLVLCNAREWTSADGKHYRHEEWTIAGGEIDPRWRNNASRAPGWEPTSRFTLYVVDGEVDVRLASYGGNVWPPAWTALFRSVRQGTYQAAIEITDAGLSFRDAALHGASCADADTLLLP